MDRSWLNKLRISPEYREGIKSFLNYIKETFPNKDKVLCPCTVCCNCRLITLVEIEEHLVCKGFLQGYTVWFCHGEPIPSPPTGGGLYDLGFDSPPRSLPSDETNQSRGDDMQALIEEGLGIRGFSFGNGDGQEAEQRDGSNLPSNGGDKEAQKFQKLMEDAKDPLYDGCKNFSRLSFIIRLFHLKCMHGWSNKSFSMLMEMLSEAFPEGSNLPNDAYSTKKYLKAFDLGYEKIHACQNDCILYRGEYENRTTCPVCGAERYRNKNPESDEFEDSQVKEKKKKPTKVLRYFPLIPRLQRLYMSSKTSSSMRWHKNRKRKHGRMVHPSDSQVWESFDEEHPDFAEEERNIKIGIAADGVNPFKNLSSTHSTWPVILIPYNLPPWIGMKQSSFLLSMIIPGPKGPGNDIDVYLQPLVDELKQLWDGVDTLDCMTGETFKLRAALFWSINDFPAYEILLGRSTKGRFACPVCGDETCSKWLNNGKKFCYMGHRRWLERNHAQRLRESSRNSGNVTQGSNSGNVTQGSNSSNEATGEMPTGPKRRGPTKLDDIWKMPPGQKKRVASNNLGQPIGEEGLKLSEYMTLVVKYNCPLNYESWSKVPPLTKKRLVGIVSEKFDYPAQINCWFKKTMSKKFRDYKSDLKSTYYDAKESTDFNLRNCPPNVAADQWAFLVDHWNSEKGKKAEERAKTCRAQQKITHTTGSKSFARFGAEMDIANGAEVGRIEKYEATHTKKDGSYLDPAVKELVEKAKAKKMEIAATPSDNPQRQEIEILAEVLGNQRYGRVSGLGTGPTPTSVFGPFPAFTRSSVSELEMAAMNKKLMEQDIEISTLKRQMAQIMSAVGQSQPIPATSPGNTLGSSSHSSHHPAGQQNRTI